MIIVVQSIGQIGNRLAQFSHLIAFARDHEVHIANPAFSLYSEFFNHTHHDLLCRYPSQSANWIGKFLQIACYYTIRLAAALRLLKLVPNSCWIDHHWTADDYDLGSPQFIEAASKYKFVFLTGSYKHRYWENYGAHIEAIREHFRLVPEIRERIVRHFTPVREAGDIVVGVHIRQGDNFTDPVRTDGFSAEAYVGVMWKILALFPQRRVVFLVCSNQNQDERLFHGLKVFRGPGPFIEDMYILAECDYIVGAGQSSFTRWASVMGQKPLYPLLRPDKEITPADFVLRNGPD